MSKEFNEWFKSQYGEFHSSDIIGYYNTVLAAWSYQQVKIDDLTLEIQHLKEELQVTKDQRSAAFRKIEELLDETNKE